MIPNMPSLPVGYSVRRARHADLDAMVAFLGAAVPDCLPETVWQLPWRWPHYVLLRDERGELAATGSLQPVDDLRTEIRGLFVAASQRGRGLASIVVRILEGDARRQGREVVCVTKKPEFFRKLGFRATPATWLDSQRRNVGGSGAIRVGMRAAPAASTWSMSA